MHGWSNWVQNTRYIIWIIYIYIYIEWRTSLCLRWILFLDQSQFPPVSIHFDFINILHYWWKFCKPSACWELFRYEFFRQLTSPDCIKISKASENRAKATGKRSPHEIRPIWQRSPFWRTTRWSHRILIPFYSLWNDSCIGSDRFYQLGIWIPIRFDRKNIGDSTTDLWSWQRIHRNWSSHRLYAGCFFIWILTYFYGWFSFLLYHNP